jgi:lysine 6-dehydrogenase
MKLLVLGGGLMGRAAAYDMVRQPDVDTVVIADVNEPRAAEAARFARSDKAVPLRLDARDRAAVTAALRGVTAALGAASYKLNLDLSRVAIASGVHWCDMGGNNTVVDAQLALDADAKRAGVSIIPDTGLAPGMVSPLAMHGVRAMDEARSVHIRVGGLPQHPRPPLNYALVFSVEGLVNEYVEPCVAIRDGRVVSDVHPLVDVEEIGFAPPLEGLEAFNTSGGTSTLPRTLLGKVRDLDYKTIRYSGHAAIMRAIFELGLMSSVPAEFRGVRIAPRDVLEPLIAANVPSDESDLVLMRVTVDGTKDGKWARAVYEMVDRKDESTGLTAMMRGTAFPSAIVCLMMARGQTPPGATPQELALDLDAFIAEVKKRGLPLETSFEVR